MSSTPTRMAFARAGRQFRRLAPLAGALLLATVSYSHSALANSADQAYRIHVRIAGVPPTQATLDQMTAFIDNNQVEQAAYVAMDNPSFYNVTLKHWATPWTNRDGDQFAELNDYVATVIGMVRDDVDFRELLFADLVYKGKASLNLPPYAANSNSHYQALESQGHNLMTALEPVAQSSVNGLPAAATAGIFTSRGAAKSFFIDGTNRAMFRFTLINHLCTDLEAVHDNSRATDRIRQDVSRSPGGDSRLFINNCSGCHAGMDPMAQAFAYYNFSYDVDTDPEAAQGQLRYNGEGQTDPATQSRVVAKYRINSNNFKFGFITENDQWQNYWRQGVNQKLGWDNSLPGQGQGAKSMGQELAYSTAFAQCQVSKVFNTVCLREPEDANDRQAISSITSTFAQSGYQLKKVFAATADYCKGN